jgi:hypothetical protein
LEEGMRLVVICAVLAGDSPISINWLKDGDPLTDDLEVEMVNEFTSSITFNSLSPKHSGKYTCIANNNAAQTNYSSVLTVNSMNNLKNLNQFNYLMIECKQLYRQLQITFDCIEANFC